MEGNLPTGSMMPCGFYGMLDQFSMEKTSSLVSSILGRCRGPLDLLDPSAMDTSIIFYFDADLIIILVEFDVGPVEYEAWDVLKRADQAKKQQLPKLSPEKSEKALRIRKQESRTQ